MCGGLAPCAKQTKDMQESWLSGFSFLAEKNSRTKHVETMSLACLDGSSILPWSTLMRKGGRRNSPPPFRINAQCLQQYRKEWEPDCKRSSVLHKQSLSFIWIGRHRTILSCYPLAETVLFGRTALNRQFTCTFIPRHAHALHHCKAL